MEGLIYDEYFRMESGVFDPVLHRRIMSSWVVVATPVFAP